MSTETIGTAIQVRGVTRSYRSATALDDVTVSFEKDMIHGLLGRNGAGKTSLMSIITGQDWPSQGEVDVFGQRPHENEQVLPQICFVREDQRYIDDAKAIHEQYVLNEADDTYCSTWAGAESGRGDRHRADAQ